MCRTCTVYAQWEQTIGTVAYRRGVEQSRKRIGRWSRYYQSLRLVVADTDGGNNGGGGGGAVREQVCVFVCDGMQIQRPEGQRCSRNRRNKEKVGIYLMHAFSKTRNNVTSQANN